MIADYAKRGRIILWPRQTASLAQKGWALLQMRLFSLKIDYQVRHAQSMRRFGLGDGTEIH